MGDPSIPYDLLKRVVREGEGIRWGGTLLRSYWQVGCVKYPTDSTLLRSY